MWIIRKFTCWDPFLLLQATFYSNSCFYLGLPYELSSLHYQVLYGEVGILYKNIYNLLWSILYGVHLHKRNYEWFSLKYLDQYHINNAIKLHTLNWNTLDETKWNVQHNIFSTGWIQQYICCATFKNYNFIIHLEDL